MTQPQRASRFRRLAFGGELSDPHRRLDMLEWLQSDDTPALVCTAEMRTDLMELIGELMRIRVEPPMSRYDSNSRGVSISNVELEALIKHSVQLAIACKLPDDHIVAVLATLARSQTDARWPTYGTLAEWADALLLARHH